MRRRCNTLVASAARKRRNHEACAGFTAQHSFDESGQMSWQADMDMPLSYGTSHSHTYTHTLLEFVGVCGDCVQFPVALYSSTA